MFKRFSTLTFLGLLALSAVRAQSGQPMQAEIPFAFTVGDTALAADNYNVRYSYTSHVLSIRGLDRNLAEIFTMAVPDTTANGPSKLVFHCYGGACRLAEVSEGAGGLALKIPEGRRQHQVAAVTRAVLMTTPLK
jgi:hypothetical protein